MRGAVQARRPMAMAEAAALAVTVDCGSVWTACDVEVVEKVQPVLL